MRRIGANDMNKKETFRSIVSQETWGVIYLSKKHGVIYIFNEKHKAIYILRRAILGIACRRNVGDMYFTIL